MRPKKPPPVTRAGRSGVKTTATAPAERKQPTAFHTAAPGEGLFTRFRRAKVVLLPVDPYQVHVYWEYADTDLRASLRALGCDERSITAELRFHEQNNRHEPFGIPVRLGAKSWYVHLLAAGCTYRVSLDLIAPGGRRTTIAASNIAATPPDQPPGSDHPPHHPEPEITSDVKKRFEAQLTAALAGDATPDRIDHAGHSDELTDVAEHQFRRNLPSS